jgi:hypothetical protein
MPFKMIFDEAQDGRIYPKICRIEIVNLQKMTLLHRPDTANMQFLSR